MTLRPANSLVLCAIYYVVWMYILPRLQRHRIRPEIVSLSGSAATHRLVKVPVEKLAAWDSAHDASGRLIADQNEKEEQEEGAEGFKA